MIKVFKAKDLIKYSIRVLIPIIVLMFVLQTVSKQKIKSDAVSYTNDRLFIGCITDSIMEIKMIKEGNSETGDINNFIFLSELGIMGNLGDSVKIAENNDGESSGGNEDASNNNEGQNAEANNSGDNDSNVQQAQTGVTTEVIPNNVNPRITNEYNGVNINNTSDKSLNSEILNPDIEINKSKVIIYHTHTCESYTPTDNFYYEMDGNYRSIDLNYSVARVGDELDKQLTSYGIQVIHDKTYHDYPSYNGSYSRSLVTGQNALSNNPDTDIIIDLHRDAIADASYAPKVKIGEEYASQLMFVIGANNEGWNQNLKFAIKIMQKSNELYPGLFKPIILRNAEYNQHLSKAACIIEVGATGNTLEESINSMRYLAKIINEL